MRPGLLEQTLGLALRGLTTMLKPHGVGNAGDRRKIVRLLTHFRWTALLGGTLNSRRGRNWFRTGRRGRCALRRARVPALGATRPNKNWSMDFVAKVMQLDALLLRLRKIRSTGRSVTVAEIVKSNDCK